MFAPPAYARPSWLPLRLWIGSAGMATLFLLAQGGSGTDVLRLLVGLLDGTDAKSTAARLDFFSPLVHTALLLLLALGTAFATAFTVTIQLFRLAPTSLRVLPIVGRLLACAPLFGLLWVGLSGWISTAGGVVETLLPHRPYGFGESWQETTARQLWYWLAPTLALALPTTGLLIARFSDVLQRHAHAELRNGLRARGLTSRLILDQHLLRLWLPRWRHQIEASLFFLIINCLVVENILNFPGSGSTFVRALQQQDPRAIAVGIYSTGILAALLSLGLRLHPRPSSHLATPQALGRLVPSLFFLLISLPIIGWIMRVSPTMAWFQSWLQDGIAIAGVVAVSAVAGPVVAALRLTVLGEWLRRYGLLETLIWSPLAVWAVAWSHAPGGVVSIDHALAVLATIYLSVQLHACTRRMGATPHLLAAKALGATAWQAWRRHALRPWLKELTATLLTVAAGTWWLRILSHSLLPATKADPNSSLGSYLVHHAPHALTTPQPLLHATLAASVSILFLWTLSRIIHPHDDL